MDKDKDKDKKDRKATAGHLALRFEQTTPKSQKGTSNAVLSYQDGDCARRFILGQVAPTTAESDFGAIPCWGFTPSASVEKGVKIAAFKKKTARDVKTGVSDALFQALMGQSGAAEAEAVSTAGPARHIGAAAS